MKISVNTVFLNLEDFLLFRPEGRPIVLCQLCSPSSPNDSGPEVSPSDLPGSFKNMTNDRTGKRRIRHLCLVYVPWDTVRTTLVYEI